MSSLDLLKKYRRPFPSGTVTTAVSSNHPLAPNVTPLKGLPPIDGMQDWLSRLGYQAKQLNDLNVIHVAGTKGKGSTCALVDCFLREHGKRTGVSRKIGLYTSPSLRPNNRIRVDSQAISEEILINRINEVERGLSLDKDDSIRTSWWAAWLDHCVRILRVWWMWCWGRGVAKHTTPGILHMTALVAFHHFVQESVDVVICEAHHGGQFDATNFIARPRITAITKIGMDHVDNLGGSLRSIAWHKSGIFKEGVPALSAPQVFEAEDEMRRRAKELGAPLQIISDITASLSQFVKDNTLDRILPEQRENFALAAQITHKFLQAEGHALSEQDIIAGIDNYNWPGRFNIVSRENCTWYLDGAHNETSVELAAQWYERLANARSARVLVFAHFSPPRTRDGKKILETLGQHLGLVDHVIFVKEIEVDPQFSITKKRLDEYAEAWSEKWPSSLIYKEANVRAGIEKARHIGSGAQILVTGSIYLVDAFLEELEGS